jgi:hypothetical protein
MTYALIGLLIGITAACAVLSAGAGLTLAILAFMSCGILALLSGLAIAAVCVLRADRLEQRSDPRAVNS